jgi:uncharacterized protein
MELMPEDEAEAWLQDSARRRSQRFRRPEPFQSFRTVGELDGQTVRIPGFVVPIETDGEGN